MDQSFILTSHGPREARSSISACESRSDAACAGMRWFHGLSAEKGRHGAADAASGRSSKRTEGRKFTELIGEDFTPRVDHAPSHRTDDEERAHDVERDVPIAKPFKLIG